MGSVELALHSLCALKRLLGWLAESSDGHESSWEVDLTSISAGFRLNLGGYLTSAEERTAGGGTGSTSTEGPRLTRLGDFDLCCGDSSQSTL